MKPFILTALAIAAPAAAQAPDWSKATQIYITMTDRGFTPHRIVFRRARPYVLHVSNRSDKGHNLTQKSFFEFARVSPQDRIWTRTGQITLGAHERAIIRLIAPDTPPGTYQFSSTTLGDAGSDYKGVFSLR